MTWLRVDDEWANHPKVRAAGLHGRALWIVAASMCASRNTDGLVEAAMVKDYVYYSEVDGDIAVAALVASGLWHDSRTIARCDRCSDANGKLVKGAFYFHDWLEYQFTKDEAKIPAHRKRKARNSALHRDHKLIALVLDRDGTLCRYCGMRVDFRNRRGQLGGTYDHVDPDGENCLENVVVSCRDCNNSKDHRTPSEAGMILLAPGTIWTGSEFVLAGIRSELENTAPRIEVASDLAGNRSGQVLAGQHSPGSIPVQNGSRNGGQ